MLPQHYCELLTAYVDGELSTRQRKMVQRLLHKSPEARQLLRQLQADAAMLRDLPHHKLNTDLASRVVQTIKDRGLQPGRPLSAASRAGPWPAWSGWAAAAAVLLSVSALSYFAVPLFNGKSQREKAVAHNPEKFSPPKEKKRTRPDSLPNRRADREVVRIPKTGSKDQRVAAADAGKGRDRKPRKDRKRPLPGPDGKPPPDDIFTFGGTTELPPVVQPDLSVMVALQDLKDKRPTEKVRAKLKKDTAHRIDLLCRDTGKALEQVRAAFAAQGIRLVVDEKAMARLKNPRLKTKYVLYGENLGPGELVALLQQLGKTDEQTALKAKSQAQFTMVMVQSMSAPARRQISRFLGDPPGVKKVPGKTAHGKTGSGARPPQPTPADKSKKASRGQGANPSTGRSERLVLVLAYTESNSPVHPRISLSKEVKQFQAQRRPLQPGTVQVVLVLSRETA